MAAIEMMDLLHNADTGLLAALVAGVVTMLATGLGALPVLLERDAPAWVIAAGSAMAGGMMVAVTVFDLLVVGVDRGSPLEVGLGFLLGCTFLWASERYLHDHPDGIKVHGLRKEGGRRALLVLLAMFVHSFPEGIAVGVGYASGDQKLGLFVALAIAVHNIPEGTAISLPLAAEGVSFRRCVFFSILSSLPQPVGVVPAYLMVAAFQPLLPTLLGFAGGAMIYLVLTELLPKSLSEAGEVRTAWAFALGFVLLMQLQWL